MAGRAAPVLLPRGRLASPNASSLLRAFPQPSQKSHRSDRIARLNRTSTSKKRGSRYRFVISRSTVQIRLSALNSRGWRAAEWRGVAVSGRARTETSQVPVGYKMEPLNDEGLRDGGPFRFCVAGWKG
jgi:hypothetical protein